MGADPAFVPTASSQQVVSAEGFNPGEGWAAPGEQVTFLGKNGYPFQLEKALQIWEPSAVLTVTKADIGDFSSTYQFEGQHGWFNTVMFARATQSTGDNQ